MELAITVLIWTLVPIAPLAGIALVSWLISLQQLNQHRRENNWPDINNVFPN